jgi:hypothetical protein
VRGALLFEYIATLVRDTLGRFGATFSGHQMRRILVLFSAALVLLLAAPASFAATAGPLGHLDVVNSSGFNNVVAMKGWVVDLAARTRSASVLITVDGKDAGTWTPTAITRADVNSALGTTGVHGFNISLNVPAGKHLMCVTARTYATNPGATRALGCFYYEGYRQATKADMLAIAQTIDPRASVLWAWSTLPAGASGEARPWMNRIDIASGNSMHHLRAVMLHEWSHVLQYRAFSTPDPWWDAVQTFNALSGHPGDRTSYWGVEHGADCIALALGADYLTYGCPAALQTVGYQIAHGGSMSGPAAK